MDTSTKKRAKNTLLSSMLFLPALAVALWAGRLEGTECFLAVLGAIGLALGTFCFLRRRDDLAHDLFLPILLFAALGGMTWAVRGSSGFGSVKGCVFAGLMWGAAWWFIARNPGGPPARRYASGWVILALTIGIGLSGARGWGQWPPFFNGLLQTNADANEGVPIAPVYGFVWLFIAGVPWAGIGACLLAWCATEKPLAAWQWSVRLFCGFGAAFFATWLFQQYPQWFLPLYSTLKDRYADGAANPTLTRLVSDNGAAIQHLGFYLGFLLYEVGRRDWRNVTLIATVGLVNGLGWALLQNWTWAEKIWPDMNFNVGRCWESSGGISIGIAYGLAYYLVNRRQAPAPVTAPASGFPFFRVFSMIFMTVVLLWYVVGNASHLFGAAWESHMPCCAVMLYGLGLYFWRLRASLLGAAESGTPEIPKLGAWAAHFGFMMLVAWFMMDRIEFLGTPDAATPWWARFDYLYLGATAAYGALFFLTALWKVATTRPAERSSITPFFQRYPNLDWLAVYLSLTIIACSFFRGELPAWQGWLWVAQENPPAWIGQLGLACLAVFGAIWCSLSYFNPREDDSGLERFAVHLGLLFGLGLSLKNGTRGWANNHLAGDEDMWGDLYWRYIGPGMLLVLAAIIALALLRRVMAPREGDRVPHAWAFMVLVLVVQNALAHVVTGPLTNWSEAIFNLYYVLLFFITAAILYHYHFMQTWVPFLVAGIEADEEQEGEMSVPASAIIDDVGAAVIEESAADPEGVEEAPEELRADEPNAEAIEEAYSATLDEEVEALADAAEPVEAEGPDEVADGVEEVAPEAPDEVGVEDSTDLEGTPMFDDAELPADATQETEEDEDSTRLT